MNFRLYCRISLFLLQQVFVIWTDILPLNTFNLNILVTYSSYIKITNINHVFILKTVWSDYRGAGIIFEGSFNLRPIFWFTKQKKLKATKNKRNISKDKKIMFIIFVKNIFLQDAKNDIFAEFSFATGSFLNKFAGFYFFFILWQNHKKEKSQQNYLLHKFLQQKCVPLLLWLYFKLVQCQQKLMKPTNKYKTVHQWKISQEK